ncbi:MAG TPA: glycosyltransferase family 4 protein [Steroidobacteraceae bacterium]
MRLLFINYEFPPVGGGAAYASLAAARELVGMGHEVHFLTAGDPTGLGGEEVDGIRVHRVRAHRSGVHEAGLVGAASFVVSAAIRMRSLLREHHYDVCHYYFGLPTGLLSMVPGVHKRLPYVVSLRGSDVPGYEPALRFLHRALWPLTRHIWRDAFRVVANSRDLRRLAQTSAPRIPIDVIANGATVPDLNPPRSGASSGIRVLTVSRLIPRKDLETLIIALSQVDDPSMTLDIAGEGPQAESLRALARSLHMQHRVRFHGYVDRVGLARLRAAADIFVLTSVSESCSMALLEAIAVGIPAIATRVGGTCELIEHGRTGLLVGAHDAHGLCAALTSLARNAPLRRQFSEAGRALLAERFSWRIAALRYEALFLQAAGRTQPRLLTASAADDEKGARGERAA